MFSMGYIRIRCSFCDPSPRGLLPRVTGLHFLTFVNYQAVDAILRFGFLAMSASRRACGLLSSRALLTVLLCRRVEDI